MAKKKASAVAMAAKAGIKSAAAARSSKSSILKRQRSAPDASPSPDDASYIESDPDVADAAAPRETKRRRVGATSRVDKNAALFERLYGSNATAATAETCGRPPKRQHGVAYHRPLMLDPSDGQKHRASLLKWFDSVSTSRSMPWRKTWVNPRDEPDAAKLRSALERRAYEVWISEIMLQQTRVAVVIDYWNRWMARWPTIQDLAAADGEDVLSAWRGLGYYSRATRIHEGAKLVVDEPTMKGLLPAGVDDLQRHVPGVGRYTAGAISAIVFGRAEPMVDGNVLRVLSRQLGILGDVKSDKLVIDTLWAAADALAKAVAGDGTEEPAVDADGVAVSDRPGRWGQALMELGSTICAPKPDCAACPVTASCRAYNEGLALASKDTKTNSDAVVDIEDACTLCQPFEEVAGDEDISSGKPSKADAKTKTAKQSTLAAFAFTRTSKTTPKQDRVTGATLDAIVNHAKKFPVKTIKKAVREEETVVCAVRRASDGQYLIRRRPLKGLLAGLWEFPSHTLDGDQGSTAKKRKELARGHLAGLLGDSGAAELKHVGELGSVPWLFSHLKLTMHVHLFTVGDVNVLEGEEEEGEDRPCRWSEDVEAESMGTGMRKCWTLVKEAEDGL
ncbi:Adenine DNA glycosylase [Paramyrothecium foliicola]|nr:Adenine DNA glycosylase [Paramyrothecium foliicola]